MPPSYSKVLFCCSIVGFCLPRPCPSCTGDSIINYLMKKLPQVSQGNNKKQFLLFRADPFVTVITAAAKQDSSAHLSDNHSYFINISARRQRMFPAFLPLF